MIKKLIKNLFYNVTEAEKNVKDYAYSLRPLDFSNTVYPISEIVTTSWTYTAPSDGVLFYEFGTLGRSYATVSVNGRTIHHFADSYNSSYTSVHPANIRLNKGDVFSVTGLSDKSYLMSSTNFVPFAVGGGNT